MFGALGQLHAVRVLVPLHAVRFTRASIVRSYHLYLAHFVL